MKKGKRLRKAEMKKRNMPIEKSRNEKEETWQRDR